MLVIGDVHGCYKTLLALLRKCPDRDVVFVGDLIDRGPDSLNVLRLVRERYRTVLGNHEDMMLLAEDKAHHYDLWMMNGGRATLNQLGEENLAYWREWFTHLPYKIEVGDFIISHSNYAYGLTQHDRKHFTLWNRDTDEVFTDGRINIIGHTPMEEPFRKKGLIMLDTACFCGNKLTAYDTEVDKFYFQSFID